MIQPFSGIRLNRGKSNLILRLAATDVMGHQTKMDIEQMSYGIYDRHSSCEDKGLCPTRR